MLKLDGVAAFIAVAEAGSITAAGRRMGLAKSVVSERLAELERSLGARLLQRTTRKLSLTENGLTFLARGRNLLRDAEEAIGEMAERRGALAGPLRLSAPVSFGILHLGPALYPFLAAHPEIALNLELDDRFVDAGADGFDAVIRHGKVHDTRLVVRHLASSRRVLTASPAYLERHGLPASVSELGRHRAILYSNRDTDWRFEGPDGIAIARPTAAVRVNNGLVMRDAALAGAGITLLPTFMIHQELARRALRVVDIGLEAEGAEVHLAYPSQRGPSAKIAALTEHLRRHFGTPPYWEQDV
ncbi:LysR family transcriptional regulator [Bosea sp. (in: a-proteobacteria)]|jgi:DNA-binding transcriptional LysR family regulator|uniref:LysR family transcriptional regulator n=1 Tax=Bosea sp. (in: a-proteobacteria) TaxID=1871050 RepID=UPI0035652D6C